MNFLRVLDIETTGENPEVDQIIEIGWVDVYADGGMTTPRQMFVKPTVPIGVEAMAVHHLTEADVSIGIPQEQVGHVLCSGGERGGNLLAFVAHNAKFEQSFLPDLANYNFICTYKSALRLWPQAPRHSNQVLRYWLGFELPADLSMPPHRAAPDAYCTAHIFAVMLELEGNNRLKRLLAWSKEPGLLPKVNFGKHKGSQWQDIPADYLHWICDKSDMDEDVKFTAFHELTRRNFGDRA